MKSSWRKKMDLAKAMTLKKILNRKYKWRGHTGYLKARVQRGSKDPDYLWMRALPAWDVMIMVDMGCPERNPTKYQIESYRPMSHEEAEHYGAGISDEDIKEGMRAEVRERRKELAF